MSVPGWTQCLAVLNYNADGVVIGARCRKDCRHGHSARRQAYLYHRVDVRLPDGTKVKLTWDGIGVMTPEFQRGLLEGEARRPNRNYKEGGLCE